MNFMIKLEKIDREQALRYMSYKGGNMTDTAAAYIEECEKLLLDVIRPVFVYRVFRIKQFYPLVLENGLVFEGNDISAHLEGCEYAAVFAVTIGAESDQLIRRLQVGDMAKSMIRMLLPVRQQSRRLILPRRKSKIVFPESILPGVIHRDTVIFHSTFSRRS